MATRLYLSRDILPGVTFPTADAGWEKTTGALTGRLRGSNTDPYANTGTGNIAAQGTTGNDTLLTRFLSAPLDVNQTIGTGTIKGQAQFLESAAGLDARSQTMIRVIKPDGTVRGTLLAMDTGALANEFATSLTNRRIPRVAGTALTSVAALAGDRIELAVGARQHATASGNFQQRLGVNAASDLAEDETATAANNPWIEFTENITFALPDMLVTQEDVGVFYVADDAVRKMRVTQEDVGVFYVADDAVRKMRVTGLVVGVFYREPTNTASRAQAFVVG